MGHVSAPENRSRKNSRALTDKTLSRSPPPPRLGYGETAFALVERLAENVASPTGWPSRSSPRRGERRLAERVGFVPDNLAPINDLGPIGNSKSAKSTRNLSIRYKTGTPQIDNCLRRADVGAGQYDARHHRSQEQPSVVSGVRSSRRALLLQQAGDLLVPALLRPGERRRPRRIVR